MKLRVWRHFNLVINADNNEAVGYLKCKMIGVLMRYDSKKTGNLALQRHVDRGCRIQAVGDLGLLQIIITGFATT